MISPYLEPSTMSTSPGSPPELTNSKSSKSSSFQSDSDAGQQDIGHFEDISLEDLHHHTYPQLQEIYTRKLTDLDKKPRTLTTPLTTMHNLNSHSTPSLHSRDLTSKQAHSFSPGKENHQQLSLPARRQKKRQLPTNPSSTQFLPRISTSRRSRSTSPILLAPSTFNLTPPTRPSSSRRHKHMEPPVLPNKRQSWQPGRKTVKELEDEFHDSDDELPEDAIIFNIPISPRPPNERESLSRRSSPPASASHSPVAPSQLKGLGIAMPNPDVTANMSKGPPPKSPRTSMVARSVSMTSIPEDYSLNLRTAGRSWDNALSELSPDARALTHILETQAEQEEREHEEQIQAGSPRKKRSPEKRRFSSSEIELPPMRKHELLIDPLPISKEKEKHLTRTRPSWLPPKDPEEEKRHLREYQKMMAKAKQAEAKKEKQQQKEQCLRDSTRETLTRVWEEHVLPNWDTSINEPRTRELFWKGITPRNRGSFWKKAVGNDLALSDTSYSAALLRAKKSHARLCKLAPDEAGKEQEWQWFEAIKRDIEEAFPELKIFQLGGPLHQTLLDVLMAYAMYRSDIGYVYGTHFLAGLLILNLSAADSFITLSNLLNRPMPTSFITNDTAEIDKTYAFVLGALEYKLPALYAHLMLPTTKITPAEYMQPMFQTLFCSQKFGMDIASRIMDCYVFDGDGILVRACLGTLAKLEGRLYGSREEILDLLGSARGAPWDLGKEEEFMELMREMGRYEVGDKPGDAPKILLKA
ncbi:TBC domain-containing protein [Venturia nashicola]|uniref:TBC domain-containing protein C23D3.03c n=1 Tax=Venturia nashicola TaxID=86259 RepID=A0A4Z1PEF9_9PEZI|nr:TBC domain-containing protein C23D3.03c [Venturia nashicola]TLD39076.1 TBC domain-containing protein [Venturia nashicola]